MTKEEAIKVLFEGDFCGVQIPEGRSHADVYAEAWGMARQIIEREGDAYTEGYDDGYIACSKHYEKGCEGCAFGSTEEWEMPCVKCKRGCKDYYRKEAK